MKTYISILIAIAFSFYSCGVEDKLTDATGVFEATEIIVSSEANGKILTFNIQEGEKLEEGQAYGLIDSTQLHLNKMQLEATKITVESTRPDVQAQIEATQREI